MPYLNLRLSAPAPADISRKIAAVLTDLTVDCLRKNRELTVVVLDVVPSGHWHLAGAPLSDSPRATFYLDVKVTEGTNTKDEKTRFVEAVFAALESLLGNLEPASYIVIHDLRADSWGYQGLTQEHRYIASRTLLNPGK